jgi:hypothetical protein
VLSTTVSRPDHSTDHFGDGIWANKTAWILFRFFLVYSPQALKFVMA